MIPKNQRTRSRAERHADLAGEVPFLTEDDLYPILERVPDPFFLILDGVQDPHNLGACLRTADAAGVNAVIIPKDRSAPLTETARAVARGAAEKMPILQVTNLSRVMTTLSEHGVRLVGTAHDAQETIYSVDLKRPVALVLGSEGEGLRRLTREKCDVLIRIPMAGTVPCLNVSVATGVCLFEAVRQNQIPKQ